MLHKPPWMLTTLPCQLFKPRQASRQPSAAQPSRQRMMGMLTPPLHQPAMSETHRTQKLQEDRLPDRKRKHTHRKIIRPNIKRPENKRAADSTCFTALSVPQAAEVITLIQTRRVTFAKSFFAGKSIPPVQASRTDRCRWIWDGLVCA